MLSGRSRVETEHAGFSGTGYINLPRDRGSIDWSGVDGGPGGQISLAIRYALGASASRRARLVVNGVGRQVTFMPTGRWSNWRTLTEIVDLNPNRLNTIRLRPIGEDAGNIDDIQVALQAEVAQVSGGSAVERNHEGYHGTGFVNSSRNGGRIEWFNLDGRNGGDAMLLLRYALGASRARTARVVVNGMGSTVTFSPTGAWTNWETVSVPVQLVSGRRNDIGIETRGQDAGNIDELMIVH